MGGGPEPQVPPKPSSSPSGPHLEHATAISPHPWSFLARSARGTAKCSLRNRSAAHARCVCVCVFDGTVTTTRQSPRTSTSTPPDGAERSRMGQLGLMFETRRGATPHPNEMPPLSHGGRKWGAVDTFLLLSPAFPAAFLPPTMRANVNNIHATISSQPQRGSLHPETRHPLCGHVRRKWTNFSP